MFFSSTFIRFAYERTTTILENSKWDKLKVMESLCVKVSMFDPKIDRTDNINPHQQVDIDG